jgi:hypothetical protein
MAYMLDSASQIKSKLILKIVKYFWHPAKGLPIKIKKRKRLKYGVRIKKYNNKNKKRIWIQLKDSKANE